MLTRLALGARIVLSGGVSQYNARRARGPSHYLELIGARASITGMLTPDCADRYAEARSELAGWLREGRLLSREDVVEGGVRAFPDALLKLFAGENIGKLILAVQRSDSAGHWANAAGVPGAWSQSLGGYASEIRTTRLPI